MIDNDSSQMFLFSDEPLRCYETFAGVDENFLKLLSRFELLSFNYEERGVTEDQLLEVLFLKTVIQSGFPFEKVIDMLDKLPKPYKYDLTEIFWDISTEKWRHFDDIRTVPKISEEQTTFFPPEDEIIDTINDLKSLGDIKALKKIKKALDNVL